MEDELILADLAVAERRLERLEKDLKKARPAELERERDVLTLCRAALEEGRPLRALDLKGEDLKRLRGFQFLSAKPLLLVINLDEAQLTADGRRRDQSRSRGGSDRLDAISVAARPPLPLPSAPKSNSKSPSSTTPTPGVSLRSSPDRIRARSRDSRQLRFARLYFVLHRRGGRVPRVVDSQRASRAAAPSEIHSDIARGFIRAEVVSYDALVARGTMAACRDHGEVRLEGKEYVVQDGDIINFRFAT